MKQLLQDVNWDDILNPLDSLVAFMAEFMNILNACIPLYCTLCGWIKGQSMLYLENKHSYEVNVLLLLFSRRWQLHFCIAS